jgi:hypothetical protein
MRVKNESRHRCDYENIEVSTGKLVYLWITSEQGVRSHYQGTAETPLEEEENEALEKVIKERKDSREFRACYYDEE